MRAFIVGDDLTLSEESYTILKRNGCDCREGDRVPLGYASEFLAHARRDVVVLITSPHTQTALKVLRELRNISAVPILAVGPANDPKFILQVLREGATEYLDQSDLEQELDESLIRMKSRRDPQASSNGFTIGVLSASGGCGTSSIAANLAATFAKNHQKSVLFDLRLSTGDQSLLLDLQPGHSIAELCGNLERLDANMFQQCLLPHDSGIHLLAAPATFDMISSVTSQGVRQSLQLARTLFPYVVMDLDRSFATEQLSAIVNSDLLLVVMRLDLVSLCNTNRVLNHLDDLGISSERIRVVVNRFRQPRELPQQKAKQALGTDVFHFLPDDPAGMNLATNSGVPIVLQRPRSKIARGFVQLAEKLEEACRAGISPARPPMRDVTIERPTSVLENTETTT